MTPRNDFEENLQTVASCEAVAFRALAILAYLPVAYDRYQQQQRKQAARVAQAAPIPSGRVTIEGTVTSVRHRDTVWGMTVKCLVESADGWRTWGTVPSKATVRIGDRVRFRATITPKDDDKHFGWYSRPHGWETIAPAKAEVAC